MKNAPQIEVSKLLNGFTVNQLKILDYAQTKPNIYLDSYRED
jgi:hypothetical protein